MIFEKLNMRIVLGAVFSAVAAAGALSVFLKPDGRLFRRRKIIRLIFLVLIFAWQYGRTYPYAKQFHLIEYSVLSYLFYRALYLDFKGWCLWLPAFAGALLVGLGDEALQHWIPDRVSNWTDTLVNMKGAIFGMLFFVFSENEKEGTKN